MRKGYTEPDPRDDLSGMDVGRKALILARLLGYRASCGRARWSRWCPSGPARCRSSEFLERLEELDAGVEAAGGRRPRPRGRCCATSRR